MAQPRYEAIGVRALTLVTDSGNDALNSVHHRIGAAAVVSFFERIRIDRSEPAAVLEPIPLASGADIDLISTGPAP